MRWVPILSAAIVGILLYAFVMQRDLLRGLAGADGPGPEGEPAPAAPEGATPARASVVATISEARPVETGAVLRGRTEASRRVDVRSETTGLVTSEPLRRGATVEAGEVLCSLDPGTRPALLAEAEARLLEAEANERASAQLAERGFTAETTAIGNRASLQAAQALVDQARREMERLEIRAPFPGVLETDTAELGALLQPGSDCATIIDLEPIKLVGDVSEQTVEAIAVGAPVTARTLDGRRVSGRVTFVARSADPDTRTFRVEAEAPNPGGALREGLTAEITVALDGTPAHLLPQSALTLDDAGRLGVRVVEDETARFVPVSVVRDTTEGIWVAGLPERVEVITVGQDFVADGQPVAARLAGSVPAAEAPEAKP